MESESNNQMDRLLRRHGRNGDRVPVATNGDGVGTAHLDADELNAFAANELPLAARVRYVNHLADCSHCRRQIAELASAANPSLASAAGALSAAPASTSIWQRIAGWIKPPTLKYAGPVMAVLCVAAIMGVVLRSQYGDRFLTGQEPVKVPTTGTGGGERAPNVTSDGSNPGPVPPAPPVGGPTPAPAPTAAPGGAPEDAPTVAKTKDQDKNETTSGEETKVTTTTVSGKAPDIVAPVTLGNTSAPAKGGERGAPVTEQPELERGNDSGGSVAQAPQSRTENRINVPQSFPPPAPSSPTGGVANNDDRGPVMSKRSSPREGTASTQATNQSPKPEPRKQQPPADRESNRRRDGDNGSVDSTDETQTDGRLSNGPAATNTRTVANHVFTRRNGVWVDSGYSSGYPLTNVTRGTEQYRALVADEPGLGTIANQLPGDILVVWKGRAYRIR